jgi:hypothetical protein
MEQYELYCLAKGPFYETPTNRGEEHLEFAPAGLSLPPQGWTIHVSSRLADVALGVALHDQPAHLPFFDAAARPLGTDSRSAWQGALRTRQGMEGGVTHGTSRPSGDAGGDAGVDGHTLTALACASQQPSNLSLLLCH